MAVGQTFGLSDRSDKPGKDLSTLYRLFTVSFVGGVSAMKDVLMVFTSKSLATMQREGGSGNWAANKDRLRHAKWLVATRNEKSNWAQGAEAHGSAFMVGRVSGIKSAPVPEQHRFVVSFDKYADLDIPNAWPGSRNPVTYTDLATLGVNPDALEWKDFHPQPSPDSVCSPNEPSLVIDRARSMIAEAFSISPEAVKITVAL
jgi:hypothetical protein